MANHLSHFAVSADNTDRARRFYERAFGWAFQPYGPPGFYLLETSGAGKGGRVPGALQKRFEVVPGVTLAGYECTISVPDVDAAASAVAKNGGKVLMPRATIPSVGSLIRFADTENNIVCAMQYENPSL
ncbi:MAG: hypothetical protein KF691_13000 [Phycisphaeraceae bacterium]|nr:hypothetical protein [Phycisphaeraceae bacterium]